MRYLAVILVFFSLGCSARPQRNVATDAQRALEAGLQISKSAKIAIETYDEIHQRYIINEALNSGNIDWLERVMAEHIVLRARAIDALHRINVTLAQGLAVIPLVEAKRKPPKVAHLWLEVLYVDMRRLYNALSFFLLLPDPEPPPPPPPRSI